MVWIKLSRAVQLLFFTTVLQTSTCNSVTSNPKIIEREAGELHINQRKQGGFFSILGVGPFVNNTVHPRLEIRELQKRKTEWNLFLLGLSRLQNVPQSDKLSYYQIAGIHGRAFVPWDGVGSGDGLTGGYCPHSSNIFLSWHRPYLVLLEIALMLNIRELISKFPKGQFRSDCEAAFPSIRLPYFDWAAPLPPGSDSLPDSLRNTTIDVELPNGTTTIPNPLCSYRYNPLNATDMVDKQFTTWPNTVRDPSSKEADAKSRYDAMTSELNSTREELQASVYNVFLQKNFSQISNDLVSGDTFEGVHDTVHNILGRGGHMSFLSFAAYDPIFWLHHCNIDRLFAIWQELNNNSNNQSDNYVTANKLPKGTFVIPSGFIVDANTALPPFHRNDRGEFWTSRTVLRTTEFHYTYPEISNARNDTNALTKNIKLLYETKKAGASQKRNHISGRNVGVPNFPQKWQYTISVKAYKFCNEGSINIYFFLGAEPGYNSRFYANEISFIGMVGILSQPQSADNRKNNFKVTRTIQLTAILVHKLEIGEISSLSEDIVVAYLRTNLRWRATKPSGEEIPIESLLGLEVSVLCTEIQPAKDECELPKIVGEPKVVADATNWLPGGYSTGYALNQLS